MEIARAWRTTPDYWLQATDVELATALDILHAETEKTPPVGQV